MADVTYQSLQSKIQTQKSQIQSSRETIQRERVTGERSIQSLKRVSPRAKPSVWFEERKPVIETIKGRLGELGETEKELTVAEQKLVEQEQLLESKKAEGWKLRYKNGEIEFYKTTPVAPSAGGGAPVGDFTVRITWRDYRNNPEGEIKTVRGSASNLDTMKQQIGERGGQVIEVESLGGGREYRTPEMRTTTGGSFILWEASPIGKEPIKTTKEIDVYTALYEKIPEGIVKERVLVTPEKFAEVRGVPSDVFKKYTAERTVTTTTREMTQAEITVLLSKMTKEEKIAWYKEHAQFGLEGEEKKSWAEIKKEQPDWRLTIKDGEAFIETPFERHKELLRKRITAGTSQERLQEFTKFVSSAFIKPLTIADIAARGVYGEGEKALDIWARQSFEFKEKDVPEIFIESYKPGGFGFLVTAGVLLKGAFGGVGAAGVAAKGTAIGKIFTGYAKFAPYVFGGAFATVYGADIGYTAAREEVSAVPKGETLSKIFGGVTAISLISAGGYLASKPFTMKPIWKRTEITLYKMEGLDIEGVSVRKYVDVFGKKLYYGKGFKGVRDVRVGEFGKPRWGYDPKFGYEAITPEVSPRVLAQSPAWKPTKISSDIIVSQMGASKVHIGAVGTGAVMRTGITPGSLRPLVLRETGYLAVPKRQPILDLFTQRMNIASKYFTKEMGWQPKTGIEEPAIRDIYGRVRPYVPGKKAPSPDTIFKKKPFTLKPLKETVTKLEVSKDGIVSVEKYGRKIIGTGYVKPRTDYPLTVRGIRYFEIPRSFSFIDIFKQKVLFSSKYFTKEMGWQPKTGIEEPAIRDIYGRVRPYVPGKKAPSPDTIFKKKPFTLKPLKETVTKLEVSKDGIVSVEKYGRKIIGTGYVKPRTDYPLTVRGIRYFEIPRSFSFIDIFKQKVLFSSKYFTKEMGWQPKTGIEEPAIRDIYGRVRPYEPTGKELIKYQKILKIPPKGGKPLWLKKPLITLEQKIIPKKKIWNIKDIIDSDKKIIDSIKGGQVTKDGQIIKLKPLTTKTKLKPPTTQKLKTDTDLFRKPPDTTTIYDYERMMLQQYYPKKIVKPTTKTIFGVEKINLSKVMLSLFPESISESRKKLERIGVSGLISKSASEQIQMQRQTSVLLFGKLPIEIQEKIQMQDMAYEYPEVFKYSYQKFIPQYYPPYVPQGKPPPPEEIITKPPIPPPPYVLPDTTYELFGHTMGQGYNAEVRERHYVKGKKVKEGKFIKVDKRPISLNNARSLMGMALDNSAAASGRVVPVDAMAQEPIIKLIPFKNIQNKFYMKDDIFIEKTKHRIDTKGEKKQISALGWYADKTKKAAKTKTVVKDRPRARKQVDVFDMDMPDMLVNMDKIFKGVFDFGF